MSDDKKTTLSTKGGDKPTCHLYADRRLAVYQGVPMNMLPQACGAGPGTKCKHGIHRDWKEGERESIYGCENDSKDGPEEESNEVINLTDEVIGSTLVRNRSEAIAIAKKNGKSLPANVNFAFPIPEGALLRALDLFKR